VNGKKKNRRWQRQVLGCSLILIFFLLIFSCVNNNTESKFDTEKWKQKDKMGYNNHRNGMLQDLVKNHSLTGKHYNDIVSLLGDSKIYIHEDKLMISYNVFTDFGTDIDPVYTKSLYLYFNNDSIVTSDEIYEWKK
jgi:hypothetical protein